MTGTSLVCPTHRQNQGQGKLLGFARLKLPKENQGRGSETPVAVGKTLPSPSSPAKPWHPSTTAPAAGGGKESMVPGWHCKGPPCPLSHLACSPQHCQSLAQILPLPGSTGCSGPEIHRPGMQ